MDTTMMTSSDRILTTHTGSLPRPASLTDRQDPEAVRAAVRETVERQVAAGVDVIGDGEMSKPSYSTYVTERLSGFGGDPVPVPRWGYEQFPEFARKQWGTGKGVTDVNPSCDGPVSYLDPSKVEADIANLRAAAADAAGEGRAAGVFMTAASPGVIEMFMKNRYYPSTEDYVAALAEAMKPEYDAIHQAGLILQLDCPDLACAWTHGEPRTVAEFRKTVAMRLEALDHATRDIPAEAMRLHLCWGNFEGPHHNDIPLADIIDLVLRARPAVVSFEGANPRHEHEWQVFEDVRLPDGKALMPGVIDSTTNYVEHPELVAQRIARYADLVGWENVIAGTDCGFATFVTHIVVEPEITWAKLAPRAVGARLASERHRARTR
jgi:5-methyltetrahydropteroyltriglutamate--homocysteine methyltransferase